MKHFVFGAIVLLFHYLPTVLSVNIYCDFKYFPWPVLGNSYTCQVSNLNVTEPNQTVTKVSGKQLPYLTNNQVRALDIRGETCLFFPKNIINHFPNLEVIQVVNSKLKTITKGDLKPFSKLRVLHLTANRLETLEQNLFQFNHDLVRVDFKYQQIKFISYNLFDNLRKLALADFESSGCVNFYAQSGRQGIENLTKEIRINCQPIEDILQEIKILRDKVEAIEESGGRQLRQIDESDPNLKKIEAKLLKLENDYAKCSEGLDVVTRNFAELLGKADALEKSLQMKLEQTKRETCGTQEFAYQKCLLENENLQRLRREVSFVEIVCENTEWTETESEQGTTCNVKSLTVTEPDIEIKGVSSGGLNQDFDAGIIEEVKLFNGRVKFLPLRLSSYFQNLSVLSFVDCGLVTIGNKALSGLKKLRSLNLPYNKISEITVSDFVNLSLTSLDLSHNKIAVIRDGAFNSLKDLTLLKLNDNLLSGLSTQILINQTKLKFLFLQNNQLMTINSKLLASSTALEFADFSNNKCIDVESTRSSNVSLKNLQALFNEKCSNKKI